MYIFGQVTQKQRHFETFDTAKIYHATFKIIPYTVLILLKKRLRTFRREKVQKQFVIIT